MKNFKTLTLTAVGLILASQTAFAQDQDQDDDGASAPAGDAEEVFVTGSFIPRQTGNNSSPAAIVGSDDIQAQGGNTIADLVQNLTINTGAQNFTDAFTQNVSTGTSNINLRGLGVSSTLVLLNGKRQVVSGAPTDNGLLFVDTASLVPLSAIGRVEIVKDGSAALYGSDAVAGVVNFITRNNYEGIELTSRIQTVTGDSQRDINVGGIFGIGNGQTHFMAAFEYMDRTSLTTAERRFPGSLDPLNGDFSNAGFPGAFVVPFTPTGLPAPIQAAYTALFDSAGLVPGVADAIEPLLGLPAVPGAVTPVITDPSCSAGANSVVPATFPFGFCQLDFGNFFDLVPEEERILGYASLSHDFNDRFRFFLEGSVAFNDALRNNSPSFPIPSPQGLLANIDGTATPLNPFNPFGSSPVLLDPMMNPVTLPLFFIGRPIGQGAPAQSTHSSDTWRIHGRFEGEFGDNGTWEISLTHAENRAVFSVDDTLATPFSLALNGLGGTGCNPLTGTPGVGGCQFFNPFGSSLLAPAGATVPHPFVPGATIPLTNSQGIFDFFTAPVVQDYDSSLTVAEAIISNSFTAFGDRSIGYAFGIQYRTSDYSLDYDANSNADAFLFTLGGPDFSSQQDVFAVFGELNIPLHERVDLQVALRYENYDNGVGNTLDPKVGLYIQASNSISLRGSFGTSFRAPTGFQLFGSQTSVQQLIDTLPGQPTTPQFFAVRAAGGGAGSLVPEEATNWNFGFTIEPNDRMSFDFDFWSFDFDNIIVQESAQAILNANPLDSRVIRSPLTGGVVRIDTSFVNASSLKTTGIDIKTGYRIPLQNLGNIQLGFEATHILSYNLVDPFAGPVDGAGVRNFNNFGTSAPTWRTVSSFHWDYKAHDLFVFVRFVNSYLDDQNNLPIEKHVTVDLQYNLTIGDKNDDKAWRFSVGVINLFNNFPPTVLTNQGFDTRVHDPRGRLVYGRFTKGF